MTFAEWLSLSEEEREAEKRTWLPFEPGYWHSLAEEAAARFNAEFGSKPHITRVFKSLYRIRELIVAVQTDLSPDKKANLPPSYVGFRVLQFANQVPEGILVDPGPPSKFSQSGSDKRASPVSRSRVRKAGPRSHHILPLEGEIDMRVSPRIAPLATNKLLLIWSSASPSRPCTPSAASLRTTASAVLARSAQRVGGSLLGAEPPHWVSLSGVVGLGGAVWPGRDADAVAGAVGEDPNGRSVGVLDDATAGR